MASDIFGRTKAFLDSLGASNADRALSWAYLSETDSSFAIESETPNQNKTEAFVALLQQAHEKLPLTEDYFSDLQSATITNPFEKAACFRHEQNWIRGGGLRGPSSVAEQAIDVDLRQESEFLARFDRVASALNDEFDIRSNDQHLLIISALQNGGRISNNRRKKLADRVSEEVFDFVERLAKDELANKHERH